MRNYAQLISFGIVGVCATLTHYFTALFFLYFLDLNVQVSNFFGFTFGFIVSFFGQSLFTFKVPPDVDKVLKYGILAIFNYFVSAVLLGFMTHVLRFRPELSLMIVVVAIPVFTYLISKKFIFKKNSIARS